MGRTLRRPGVTRAWPAAAPRGGRRHRHWSIKAQHAALHRRLRGHFHYFGVRGNYNSMMRLVEATKRAWDKCCVAAANARVCTGKGSPICCAGGLYRVPESPSGFGTARHEPHQRESRMVEISSSGSGEGPGEGNRPAYSTTAFSTTCAPPVPPSRSSRWSPRSREPLPSRTEMGPFETHRHRRSLMTRGASQRESIVQSTSNENLQHNPRTYSAFRKAAKSSCSSGVGRD